MNYHGRSPWYPRLRLRRVAIVQFARGHGPRLFIQNNYRNMNPSLNTSAFTFIISAIVTSVVLLKSYRAWQKQKDNLLTESFVKSVSFWVLYSLLRGIPSMFFLNNALVLIVAYILSRICVGFGSAYILKIALSSILTPEKAQRGFIISLIAYSGDIALNIALPNKPYFDAQLRIVNWGTNNIVAIPHAVLPLSIFIASAVIFIYRAIDSWDNKLIRNRCLFFISGLILAAITLAPRNLIKSPLLFFFTEICMVVVFVLMFLGVTYGEKEKT